MDACIPGVAQGPFPGPVQLNAGSMQLRRHTSTADFGSGDFWLLYPNPLASPVYPISTLLSVQEMMHSLTGVTCPHPQKQLRRKHKSHKHELY